MMRFMMASAMAVLLSGAYVHSAEAKCKVNVKGTYMKEVKEDGKRVESITVNLVDSDVRAKPGFWKDMQNMCSPNQKAVSYGDSFTMSCDLDLACGKRQFRIETYIDQAGGGGKSNGDIIYVPTQGEWQDLDTNTTVNVGELYNAFN